MAQPLSQHTHSPTGLALANLPSPHVLADGPMSDAGQLCLRSRQAYQKLVESVVSGPSGGWLRAEELSSLAVSKQISAASSVAIFSPQHFERYVEAVLASGTNNTRTEVLLALALHPVVREKFLPSLIDELTPDVRESAQRLHARDIASNLIINSSQAMMYEEAQREIPLLVQKFQRWGAVIHETLALEWDVILKDAAENMPTTIFQRAQKSCGIPSTSRRLPALLWYLGESREELPESGLCLDVGAGRAAVAAQQLALWRSGLRVRAFDPVFSDPANRIPGLPANLELASEKSDRLPADDGSVRLLTAMYSLPFWAENYRHVVQFLGEVRRVLAPNGEAWITPFRSNHHMTPHVMDIGLYRAFERDMNALFPPKEWGIRFMSGCDGFEWKDPKRFRVLQVKRLEENEVTTGLDVSSSSSPS